MEIGTLLRKLRDSKKLTTRNIAEKIGVSLSTYIDWEHYKTAPSLKLYTNLANAFEMSPVELMAYFTGQITKTLPSEEKENPKDLHEIVSYLEKNNVKLLENNALVVKELNLIKELIIRRKLS